MLMVAGIDEFLGRMTHIWVMGLYRWMELLGRGGTESLISPTSTPAVTWDEKVENLHLEDHDAMRAGPKVGSLMRSLLGGAHQGGFLDPRHH